MKNLKTAKATESEIQRLSCFFCSNKLLSLSFFCGSLFSSGSLFSGNFLSSGEFCYGLTSLNHLSSED